MTAQLAPGETVLIHGATGGIGTMAIQLAKAWGAGVATTADSDEKLSTAKAFLGADIATNYNAENFPESLRAQNGGKGADVILDVVVPKKNASRYMIGRGFYLQPSRMQTIASCSA